MTIYNRPRNLFVAAYIGSPSMNFFKGQLVEKNGAVVFSSGGVDFALNGYDADTRLDAGRRLFWRPARTYCR